MEYVFIVLLFFVLLFFWINGFGNIIERFSIEFEGNDNINPGGEIELKNMCSIIPPIPPIPDNTVCFALFNNTSNTSITINGYNNKYLEIKLPQNEFEWVELNESMFPIVIPEIDGLNSIPLSAIKSEYIVATKNSTQPNPTILMTQLRSISEISKNKGFFMFINLTKKDLNISSSPTLKPSFSSVLIKIDNITITSDTLKLSILNRTTGNGFILITDDGKKLKSTVIDIYQRKCEIIHTSNSNCSDLSGKWYRNSEPIFELLQSVGTCSGTYNPISQTIVDLYELINIANDGPYNFTIYRGFKNTFIKGFGSYIGVLDVTDDRIEINFPKLPSINIYKPLPTPAPPAPAPPAPAPPAPHHTRRPHHRPYYEPLHKHF